MVLGCGMIITLEDMAINAKNGANIIQSHVIVIFADDRVADQAVLISADEVERRAVEPLSVAFQTVRRGSGDSAACRKKTKRRYQENLGDNQSKDT